MPFFKVEFNSTILQRNARTTTATSYHTSASSSTSSSSASSSLSSPLQTQYSSSTSTPPSASMTPQLTPRSSLLLDDADESEQEEVFSFDDQDLSRSSLQRVIVNSLEEAPIFLIPGLLGHGHELQDLADCLLKMTGGNKDLGGKRNVYIYYHPEIIPKKTMVSPKKDLVASPDEKIHQASLLEQANAIAKHMQLHLPPYKAPYQIVGYDYGCALAVFAADKLRKLQQEAHVYLVNGIAPNYFQLYFSKAHSLSQANTTTPTGVTAYLLRALIEAAKLNKVLLLHDNHKFFSDRDFGELRKLPLLKQIDQITIVINQLFEEEQKKITAKFSDLVNEMGTMVHRSLAENIAISSQECISKIMNAAVTSGVFRNEEEQEQMFELLNSDTYQNDLKKLPILQQFTEIHGYIDQYHQSLAIKSLEAYCSIAKIIKDNVRNILSFKNPLRIIPLPQIHAFLNNRTITTTKGILNEATSLPHEDIEQICSTGGWDQYTTDLHVNDINDFTAQDRANPSEDASEQSSDNSSDSITTLRAQLEHLTNTPPKLLLSHALAMGNTSNVEILAKIIHGYFTTRIDNFRTWLEGMAIKAAAKVREQYPLLSQDTRSDNLQPANTMRQSKRPLQREEEQVSQVTPKPARIVELPKTAKEPHEERRATPPPVAAPSLERASSSRKYIPRALFGAPTPQPSTLPVATTDTPKRSDDSDFMATSPANKKHIVRGSEDEDLSQDFANTQEGTSPTP